MTKRTNGSKEVVAAISATLSATKHGEPGPSALQRDELQAAYERILPEAEALEERLVRRFTLDCSHSYSAAMFAVARLAPLDHDLRSVSHFDVRNYTHYADYAKGTYYAHSLVLATSRGDNNTLIALNTEGTALRALLLPALHSLSARGHIAPSVLEGRGALSGYRSLMDDLVAIVAILRSVWPKVGARTLIEPHEIERASSIAQELGVLLGQRDVTGEEFETLIPRRQRCASLLINANRQLRRVVRYLREDEDLDQLVPSVFLVGTASSRSRVREPVSPLEPSVVTPARPVSPVEPSVNGLTP